MRAFIAIEIPPEVKDFISKIQDRLKAALPKVSWVKPANLHLTLKFIGEISPGQLDNIDQTISETANKVTAFKIGLETLGVFPDLSRGRIIWVGTDKMPLELEKIAEELETKLAQLGFSKEKRPFRAHITVGRIKLHLNSSNLEKIITGIKKDMLGKNLEFNLAGITVFQSTLGPAGPAYDVLKAADFKIT